MRKFLQAGIAAAVVAGGLIIPTTANAAPLDQTFCESLTSGVWTGGNTCTVPMGSLSNQAVEVPSGVTLVTDGAANTAINLDLVIDEGGTMQVPSLPATIDSGSFENSGTLDVQASFFGIGMPATNFGTITATELVADDFDNYGSVTIDDLFVEGAWVNHCTSTFTVTNVDQEGGSVTDLDCSIAVTITPAPTSGDAPLDVTWTVTLENDGDEDLTSPQVALSTDGGSTSFATLANPPTSGDTGSDGVLGVGETWSWTVPTTESADVTVTATGAGTLEGDVITFPDDPEARAAASVTVTTTTTTAPTTTTVAPPTVAPTTSIDVGATLPATGMSQDSTTTLAVVAALLIAAGLGLTLVRRRS